MLINLFLYVVTHIGHELTLEMLNLLFGEFCFHQSLNGRIQRNLHAQGVQILDQRQTIIRIGRQLLYSVQNAFNQLVCHAFCRSLRRRTKEDGLQRRLNDVAPCLLYLVGFLVHEGTCEGIDGSKLLAVDTVTFHSSFIGNLAQSSIENTHRVLIQVFIT